MSAESSIMSKGLFLAACCHRLDFEVEIILRNTLRNPLDPLATEKRKGITYALEIFDINGNSLFSNPKYGNIPFNSFSRVQPSDALDVEEAKKAELMVIIPEIVTEPNVWFEQEHEIVYSNKTTKSLPAVIYDQLPLRFVEEYPPIILLNHKIYVSKDLNSFVVLANYRGLKNRSESPQNMELSFFDNSGALLLRKTVSIPYNSTFYIDVKAEIGSKIALSDSPVLLTLTARGGNSLFAIETITINEKTKNAALEHSLAPVYFVSQSMKEVRSRALLF
ncbi:hypothetical protein LEP1GSC058_0795 [Leptospira fainei serovar Hurstbridge str. BUT 6]|uniref:Uncharacterized protein n=1 Tax=Leptospira fainei serovar Hurstbridge str. BUT 6 TaxID=1193011 RepID=S3V5A8_9LEPT|nr:hypothetical protein [Leptospira fainei]EPG75819.1 hypothetical protein LEP1GSC058_0795 [Leptospira fainei serovar Hurstbridge str. BUT 6]